jgi:Glutamyl-tRNAGlu reductase, dimerisation domain
MSPIGRALHESFAEVCRTELQRLRRKTRSLSPDHRAEVDALSEEVARGIAARLGAALERPDASPQLGDVVARLFLKRGSVS